MKLEEMVVLKEMWKLRVGTDLNANTIALRHAEFGEKRNIFEWKGEPDGIGQESAKSLGQLEGPGKKSISNRELTKYLFLQDVGL